ncbi:MAG: ABC transporter ATP-binding protein [Candidatus Brocadiia bacterium]
MKNDIINAVEVTGLEKKFGRFTAVNRISFSVKPGEIFGFLGPNGAGKTTAIRMLCGILAPTSGTGRVGGYDIASQPDLIKQNIGYMSQRFSLYDDLTVEENINFYSGIYRVPAEKKSARKEWVLRMAGLEQLRASRTSILAGGWKQRLALGCAIIHEPKILFLDEPTAGVDPIARQMFWKLIKEMSNSGVTVFVTTHYMDEAENCDRLALIYDGNIIATGTPNRLKTELMKESVLAVSLDRPEEWIEPFNRLKSVKETALFGTVLHAIVDDEPVATAAIKELMAKEPGLDYRIKRIEPSLEDVFVSLIKSSAKLKVPNEPDQD